MKKAAIALLVLLAGSYSLLAEEGHPVELLRVKGTIDPSRARYVSRALAQARETQASAVILQLDTPGGLNGSMRMIVEEILNSPVPVVVYVSPSGAQATSAGCFITLAAHVAAMAPGTRIGAAPKEKFFNDASPYIRSIAEVRNRNTEGADLFVQEGRSMLVQEAWEKNIVDLAADDLDALLEQLDGRQVRTVFGMTTLHLSDKPRRTIAPSFLEKILHQLGRPIAAYFLLLIGIYGLVFELATPGTVFPGVAGAVLLIIGLMALETLQAHWGGILLIGLSALLFIADLKGTDYGFLTGGATAAFLLGSALLFPQTRVAEMTLSWKAIGLGTVATVSFFLFVVRTGVAALKKKAAKEDPQQEGS